MPVRRGSAPGNGAARTSRGERYGAVRLAAHKVSWLYQCHER